MNWKIHKSDYDTTNYANDDDSVVIYPDVGIGDRGGEHDSGGGVMGRWLCEADDVLYVGRPEWCDPRVDAGLYRDEDDMAHDECGQVRVLRDTVDPRRNH